MGEIGSRYNKGNKSLRRAAHVNVCQPVDKVIDQLLPQTVYKQYGRVSKLLIHPKDVPHIPFHLFDERQQATEEGEKDINMLELNDPPDEPKSRTRTCMATEKLSNGKVSTVGSEEEVLVLADDYDESKSREPHLRKKEQCQMNIPVMNDTHAVIDTCDASRSRPQSAEPRQNPPTMEVSANVGKMMCPTSTPTTNRRIGRTDLH